FAVVLAAALAVVTWIGRPGQGQIQADNAAIRVQVAQRYMAMGWMAEAREHLRQAVRLAPRHVEARLLLAMNYHAEGLLEQALSHYRVAVSLDPQLVAVRVLMGDIYLALGMLAQAEAEYMAA